MGLDAIVRCRCYAEGKARPFARPELVRPDAFGAPELALPEEQAHNDLLLAFYEWERSACAHAEGEYASARISNWSGYRALQEALGKLGWEHFPTLRAVLPEANGGQVAPADSARCLSELARFESFLNELRVAWLVDTTTGEALYDHVASYQGVFLHGQGLEVGFDAAGLFVRRREGPELFRARQVVQRPLGVDPKGPHELLALDSEARTELPWPVLAGRARLHVERRARSAEDFRFQLDALRKVFTASVEVGMPVEWC